MTRFLLIRHATHDWLSKGIAGRSPNVFLNEAGRSEAVTLGQELVKLKNRLPISTLYSSPIERTIETAQLLSTALDLPIITDDSFIEIDYGKWTGKTFSELHQEPLWIPWNERRSTVRVPGGETIQEVQYRVSKRLLALGIEHPSRTIAIVSHGDPIKSVLSLCGLYELNDLAHHQLRPASVTLIQVVSEKLSVLSYDKEADEVADCSIEALG